MVEEYLGGTSLHCALRTTLSKDAIAALYGMRGWQVRKCAWTDYEVRCGWAELVIDAESPVLMHGLVADVLAHMDEILEPLRTASIPFVAECYDMDMTLLKEFSSQV
jgi:hypothetical protein